MHFLGSSEFGSPPTLKTLHERMDRPYGKVGIDISAFGKVSDLRPIYSPRKRRPRWNVLQGFSPPTLKTLHERMDRPYGKVGIDISALGKVSDFRPIYCPHKRRPMLFWCFHSI